MPGLWWEQPLTPGRLACSAPRVEGRGAWACSGAPQLFKVTDPFIQPNLMCAHKRSAGARCVLPTAPGTCPRSSVPGRDTALLTSFFPPPAWARGSGSTFAWKSWRAAPSRPAPGAPGGLSSCGIGVGLGQDACQCHQGVGAWSVSGDGVAPIAGPYQAGVGGSGVVRPQQVGSLSAAPEALFPAPLPPPPPSHLPWLPPWPGGHRPEASLRVQGQGPTGRSLWLD